MAFAMSRHRHFLAFLFLLKMKQNLSAACELRYQDNISFHDSISREYRSPGFPSSLHENLTACLFTFQANPRYKVDLILSVLLDPCCDSIQVYDGQQLVQTITGNVSRAIITSTNEDVSLNVTASSKNSKGFVVTYRQFLPTCGTKLTAEPFLQYLSNSGGSALPVECIYEIQSRKGLKILLRVEKLMSGVNLEVSDPYKSLGNFTGPQFSQAVITSTILKPLLKIRISSNSLLLNDDLFKIAFITSDYPKCNAGDDCFDEAECQNSLFGHLCSCRSGFTLNKIKCNEKDECDQGAESCAPSKSCKNSNESFMCACESKNCHKSDECDSKNSPCHRNAHCFKESGSVKCKCEEGYSGDGFTCRPTENSQQVTEDTKDSNSATSVDCFPQNVTTFLAILVLLFIANM